MSKAKVPRKSQDDFETVAKKLECDEDRDAFEAKLGKIAKTKPQKTTSSHS